MKASTIPFKPLLAALALVLATTACQQRTDDTLATPANDATVPPPVTPTDTTALPPTTHDLDPCAGLMGTELDECLRRQNEMQTTPPIIDETQPLPPDPMDDTTTLPTDPPTTPPQP